MSGDQAPKISSPSIVRQFLGTLRGVPFGDAEPAAAALSDGVMVTLGLNVTDVVLAAEVSSVESSGGAAAISDHDR